VKVDLALRLGTGTLGQLIRYRIGLDATFFGWLKAQVDILPKKDDAPNDVF